MLLSFPLMMLTGCFVDGAWPVGCDADPVATVQLAVWRMVRVVKVEGARLVMKACALVGTRGPLGGGGALHVAMIMADGTVLGQASANTWVLFEKLLLRLARRLCGYLPLSSAGWVLGIGADGVLRSFGRVVCR